MPEKPIFADGNFTQSGVSFPFNHLYIMDELRKLTAQQLKTLAQANNLPWHPEISRNEVEFVLGSVVQCRYQEVNPKATKELLAKVNACEKEYARRYCELAEKANKGELAMAKKAKSAKKKSEPKEKAPKQVMTYEEADAAKLRGYEDGIFVKDNGETKMDNGYKGHIARVLLDEKGPLPLAELISRVAKSMGVKVGDRSTYDGVCSQARFLAEKLKLLKKYKAPLAA